MYGGCKLQERRAQYMHDGQLVLTRELQHQHGNFLLRLA